MLCNYSDLLFNTLYSFLNEFYYICIYKLLCLFFNFFFFYGFPSAINRDETPGQRNFDLFDVRPMGPNF